MLRAVVTLLGGIVIGIAIAHFVFGPIDWAGFGEHTGDVVNDAATVAAVRAALALQKDFELFGDIEVSVSAAVVTLSGHVATLEQKQLAELICRGVQGVGEVVNELEVRAGGGDDAVGWLDPPAAGLATTAVA
jgi:hypothetical protein